MPGKSQTETSTSESIEEVPANSTTSSNAHTRVIGSQTMDNRSQQIFSMVIQVLLPGQWVRSSFADVKDTRIMIVLQSKRRMAMASTTPGSHCASEDWKKQSHHGDHLPEYSEYALSRRACTVWTFHTHSSKSRIAVSPDLNHAPWMERHLQK